MTKGQARAHAFSIMASRRPRTSGSGKPPPRRIHVRFTGWVMFQPVVSARNSPPAHAPCAHRPAHRHDRTDTPSFRPASPTGRQDRFVCAARADTPGSSCKSWPESCQARMDVGNCWHSFFMRLWAYTKNKQGHYLASFSTRSIPGGSCGDPGVGSTVPGLTTGLPGPGVRLPCAPKEATSGPSFCSLSPTS